MLTPEILKADEKLATLTDEQIAAVTTLSANDENTVIASKIGELHGLYDKDIKEVSGVEKNQGEKSYEYAKRVISDFKAKLNGTSELQTKIATYETEITDLKKKIEEGKGDEVVRKQLKDAQTEVATLKTQYESDKSNWEKEKEGFSTQITQISINSEFKEAKTGLKFKPVYPKEVQETLLNSAQATILGMYKPDWLEENGQKTMVFRDSKGEIVRNKANSLNPYTAQELLKEKLGEVLDLGQKKTGTNTDNPGTETDPIEAIDIAGAKTQVEADELIYKHLMQIGEARGTASFADKQKKLREENNVSKLPIR